jgi:hypothetical protein
MIINMLIIDYQVQEFPKNKLKTKETETLTN